MGSKHYRLKIILRIGIILLLLILFSFLIQQHRWYVSSGVCFLLIIGASIELIKFIDISNKELAQLATSIRYQDSLIKYRERKKNKLHPQVLNAFNSIISEFNSLRIDKELHFQFLSSIVEHISLALICFEKSGKIKILNSAFRKLFSLQALPELSYLKNTQPELYDLIVNSKLRQEVVKISLQGETHSLLMERSLFKMEGKLFYIISLQNIGTVLQSEEMESWKKLIRVLTHEIMNSVTPVFSLSTAINDILHQSNGERINWDEIEEDEKNDLYDSIKTIQSRSQGLIDFVNVYKNLSKLPEPQYIWVELQPLLKNIYHLMKVEAGKHEIIIKGIINEKTTLLIDREMIERTLINLIRNAIDSFNDKNGHIKLSTYLGEDQQCHICVADNGEGIEEEYADKIFIPFFTSKEKGSGIGLSLSQQIMHLHQGNITFVSQKGQGSKFCLHFPSYRVRIG